LSRVHNFVSYFLLIHRLSWTPLIQPAPGELGFPEGKIIASTYAWIAVSFLAWMVVISSMAACRFFIVSTYTDTCNVVVMNHVRLFQGCLSWQIKKEASIMGSVRSLNWRKNEGWAFFSSTRRFKFFCKKARGKYVKKICKQVCL
jgi:hypothetical protein